MLSPATGQDRTPDRTEERLSALETRVAVLEESLAVGSADTTAPTEIVETFTLTGSIVLIGGSEGVDHIGGYTGAGSPCTGERGYDDLREDAGVTIRNEAGEVIATSGLTAGEAVALGVCEFGFAVTLIPFAEFYSVEISHRGALTYSFADLEQMNWSLTLEIGDR